MNGEQSGIVKLVILWWMLGRYILLPVLQVILASTFRRGFTIGIYCWLSDLRGGGRVHGIGQERKRFNFAVVWEKDGQEQELRLTGSDEPG